MGSGLVGGPLTGSSGNTGSTIAPAGQSAILAGPLGTGATDVVTKAGSTTADASINATASLLVIAAGIGGTEVDHAAFRTGGANPGFVLMSPGTTGALTINNTIGSRLEYNSVTLTINATTLNLGNILSVNASTGALSQFGTDDSANPGNRTINKSSGISAVANATATATITNSLIPAVATARVRIMLSLMSDPGAAVTRVWATQTAGGGSFVINFNGVAAADTLVAWEVCSIM